MLEGTVMCRCKHHWKKGGKEGRTTFSSISFRAALKSRTIAMCDTMRTAFLHISGFERGKKGGEESSPPSSGQERCNAGMKNRFMRRHRTRSAQSRCLGGKCHDTAGGTQEGGTMSLTRYANMAPTDFMQQSGVTCGALPCGLGRPRVHHG